METPRPKDEGSVLGGKRKAKKGNPRELLKFLKENKILHYKDSDIEVTFSPLAFIPENIDIPQQTSEDDKKLLYYSSRN